MARGKHGSVGPINGHFDRTIDFLAGVTPAMTELQPVQVIAQLAGRPEDLPDGVLMEGDTWYFPEDLVDARDVNAAAIGDVDLRGVPEEGFLKGSAMDTSIC